MTLPRPPALPVTETTDVGAFLSDLDGGVAIPNVRPLVDKLREIEIEYPRLRQHQVARLRRLMSAMHGPAGWWQFNLQWIGASSDSWVWVRFADQEIEDEWVAPDQYAVRLRLKRRVDPLAA